VTTYSEKTLTSLLDGANDADGDAISVYRLDGAVPSSWPHSVALTEGSALVAQDGTITFDDGGDTSAHPSSGSQANGSFSFTLWDGMDESAPYTASVALEATGVETFAPARPSAAGRAHILPRRSQHWLIPPTRLSSQPNQALMRALIMWGERSLSHWVVEQGTTPLRPAWNISALEPVTASLTLVSSGNVKQALTDLVNTVGRQNRPVTPVTAITLPSGVSIDGSQPIVRITGNNVNMSNVDFTGFRVSVTGDNGTLFHNKFGSESGPIIVNQNYMLDLQAGATGWDIYENDFVGFPGYSGGGTDNRLDEAACIWQSPTASGPSVIRRNLMYWFKNDGLKPTNLSACSENVILPPWQLDGLETYSSTKSYNTGDQVLEQSGYGRVFIALQGSQGKSLPSGGALATNTWWKGYDPHTDLYNPRVNLNQYTFYRNVFYRQADHSGIPHAMRSQGAINIVNSGRILRNTNSSATFVKLILEECASIGQAVHGSQMPFTADDGGQGNWTSVNMINCYIDADNGGYRNGGGWGNFTGNVDYTTDAAIS